LYLLFKINIFTYFNEKWKWKLKEINNIYLKRLFETKREINLIKIINKRFVKWINWKIKTDRFSNILKIRKISNSINTANNFRI
jgi:hypothetical protein